MALVENPASKSHIYLTGFMCSGKSTVGKILANSIGWDFTDLDLYIEEQEGLPIPEIFARNGEEYFRQREAEALNLLAAGGSQVISLGGGTIYYFENLDRILQTGWLVYLNVPLPEIYRRLKYKTNRPLFQTTSTLVERTEGMKKLQDLFDQRRPYYERADIVIESHSKPVGVTIDEIVKRLKRLGIIKYE